MRYRETEKRVRHLAVFRRRHARGEAPLGFNGIIGIILPALRAPLAANFPIHNNYSGLYATTVKRAARNQRFPSKFEKLSSNNVPFDACRLTFGGSLTIVIAGKCTGARNNAEASAESMTD